MKDTLITYETAVLTKEKGFDIPVHTMYESNINNMPSPWTKHGSKEIRLRDGHKYECQFEDYNWNQPKTWGIESQEFFFSKFKSSRSSM